MRKIRRKCRCGCGNVANYNRRYINGHNKPWLGKKLSEEHKQKLSLAQQGKKHSEENKQKISEALLNNTNALGYKHTNKAKKKISEAVKNRSPAIRLKMVLGNIKHNPNYEYCDVWKDGEYKKDIRKDYCENKDCKKISKQFQNHHIYLDKKRCAPNDIITLCASCHMVLHRLLEEERYTANPKHYIIINRPDHVSYINKLTRKIIRINKRLP